MAATSELKPAPKKALLRFFSMDSTNNIMPNINPPAEYNYNFYSKGFFLKIAQLINGIVCAGLYSEAVKIMTDSIPSMCFPNVVFSSFIIITSVVVLSYMLGHAMPEAVVRIFNAMGLILYFVSATVTLTAWFQKEAFTPEMEMPKHFLLIQSLLSYVNFFLYGLDMFFSIKDAIACEL